jgi:hypothetical protein
MEKPDEGGGKSRKGPLLRDAVLRTRKGRTKAPYGPRLRVHLILADLESG